MKKQLTKEEVRITLECIPEDMPVRGNLCNSDEPDLDKEDEDKIIKSREGGNEWAWCIVRVTVSWRNLLATDILGGCSYDSEEDFKQPGGSYDDMVDEALAELNANLVRVLVCRGGEICTSETEAKTVQRVEASLRITGRYWVVDLQAGEKMEVADIGIVCRSRRSSNAGYWIQEAEKVGIPLVIWPPNNPVGVIEAIDTSLEVQEVFKNEAWETPCPERADKKHCNHWYDGDPCHACGDVGDTSGSDT